MSENVVMTINEVAKKMKVSPRLVRTWCDSGMIKGAKLGGSWRVWSKEVNYVLEFGTREPDTDEGK